MVNLEIKNKIEAILLKNAKQQTTEEIMPSVGENEDFVPRHKLKLHRPISQNSMESDHGCTLRIYFDNAGDNVTLTSRKPC